MYIYFPVERENIFRVIAVYNVYWKRVFKYIEVEKFAHLEHLQIHVILDLSGVLHEQS